MRLGRTSVTIIYFFHKDEISPLHFVSVEMTTIRLTISNLVTSTNAERSNPFIFFNSLRFLDYAQYEIIN